MSKLKEVKLDFINILTGEESSKIYTLEKKNTNLHLDKLKYYHATINGIELFGAVYKSSGGKYYLFQNLKAGSKPFDAKPSSFGFLYSWVFTPNDSSSDTKLIKEVTDSEEIIKLNENNVGPFRYNIKKNSENGLELLYDKKQVISFSVKQYPACCGSTILYNISVSEVLLIDALTKVEKLLKTYYTTNLNSICNSSDVLTIAFLKYMGFEQVDSFIEGTDTYYIFVKNV